MEPYPHRRRGQLRRAGGLGRVATGRLVDRPLRYAPGIGAQRLGPRACHYLLVLGDHSHHLYLAYGVGRVIFASPVQIGSSVVVSRWFIRMRGRAIGTLFMSHSIGMIASPLIASAVIAGRGWQDASMLLGLLGLGHCPASRGPADGRAARGRGLAPRRRPGKTGRKYGRSPGC